MLATLVIELTLLTYVLLRYRLNAAARLIALILAGLAGFQLAEYHVCTGAEQQAVAWSRLGFVAITTLPPLGLHLMHVLAGRPARKLVMTAYIAMIGFAGYFLTAAGAFSGHQCTGNYVIFQFSDGLTAVYSLYYYGWVAAAIYLGWRWTDQSKPRLSGKSRQAVRGLIAGYLAFLLPAGLTHILNPETLDGIPSILCGFAVLLALTLGLYVLPKASERIRRKA